MLHKHWTLGLSLLFFSVMNAGAISRIDRSASSPASTECAFGPSRLVRWNTSSAPEGIVSIARKSNIPLDLLLGKLADEHFRSEYTEDEFLQVLGGLEALLEGRSSTYARIVPSPNELRCYLRKSEKESPLEIVVFLDPTCGRCGEIWRLLKNLEQRCEKKFPPVVPRLYPSSEEYSQLAAAMLQIVAERAPEAYCAAIDEVLIAPPHTTEEVADLRQHFLQLTGKPISSQDIAEAQRRIAARVITYPDELQAPALVFANRKIIQTSLFDPLRSEETLLQVLLLLRIHEEGTDEK